MNHKKLARALGWFSIGLGLVEVAAPGSLNRFLGVNNRTGMVRAFGLRAPRVGLFAGLITGVVLL